MRNMVEEASPLRRSSTSVQLDMPAASVAARPPPPLRGPPPPTEEELGRRLSCGRDDGRQHVLHRVEHVPRRNAQSPYTPFLNPSVAPTIMLWSPGGVMAVAVDFDGQPG